MTIYHFLTTACAVLLLSCGNSFKEFQELALQTAPDGISEQEYKKLADLVKATPKDFRQFYQGDTFDESKMVDYLGKYYKAKNVAIALSDIRRPINTNTTTAKFNINVFFENSGSMNGYVGTEGSFKTTIFKLLTDLKRLRTTESLNLNYINTKLIPIKSSVTRDDIDDFYKRLNPTDFKKAGGSTGSSDMEHMIRTMLDRVDARNLNVFVSDCVFSPGKKDARRYLDGQYAAIYNDFVDARDKHSDLSVIVLQCQSKFVGAYYDYLDVPHVIDADRPYYIWFIGTSAQIASVINGNVLDQLKEGYKNKFVLQAVATPLKPAYKIQYRPRIGEFELPNGAQGPIVNAAFSDGGREERAFGFNVAVDFSKSLQDDAYFLDTNNYLLSSDYGVAVERLSTKDDETYTHLLKLRTNNLREEVLKINVLGKMPTWVYRSSSPDDTRIDTNEEETNKTFGLKELMEGVSDAFYPRAAPNTISTININIKK